ncbi:MAG: 30S ribosomal protein S5, partial [Candidatus Diapherotrites archaeon]|nr:30S ribosomal protein S5 [Candidatus Diapherotrites archaeon]
MAYFKREEKEWIPLTDTGRDVKSGEISSLEEMFKKRLKVMEPEIVDTLLPDLHKNESIDFKRTIRMNRNGRQPSYQSTIAIGNGNGY